jgi:hypothetical protein
MTFKARDWVELIVSQQGLTKGFTGEVQGCVKCHSSAGPFWVYAVYFPGFGLFDIPEKDLVSWVDPESVMAADEVPKPTVHAPPLCSFCGEPNAASLHVSGLRCQAEPWHYCARVGCCESIDLHVSRLENGLVDCPETRAATRAWYHAKVERHKKEARESAAREVGAVRC